MADRRQNAAVPGPPTLVDVARAAGVSRQTVSNVLHAPDRVRAETRRHVAQVIAELGYQPNRAAQDLRAQASRMIGYRIRPVAPGALTSLHDRFLHALAEAGRAAGRHLLVFTADDAGAEVEAAARLCRSGAAAGLVLYDVTAADVRPGALLGLGVPFVAFGRTAADTDRYAWVDVDNAAGTASAVDHLVHRGHRRIGYLGLPAGNTVGDRRAQGWGTAIEGHGLTAESRSLDVRGEDSVTAGAELTYALLDRDEPPTAVVAATDTLAVGVLRAARQWGLEAGRDLAVVGFDDTPTAAAFDLSSVRQPVEEAGRQAMAELIAATSPAVRPPVAPPPTGRLLGPRLVIRASSASPAATGR